MKKIKKILTITILSCFLTAGNVLTAQSSPSAQGAQNQQTADGAVRADSEEIQLPEMTTVISGNALTAEKDSIPDFTGVLPENFPDRVEFPAAESISETENMEFDAQTAKSTEENIFADGKIGGGFPFYFTGDFSVYRATGSSPFAVDFSHESNEGLGGKSAEDGAFFRETNVALEKTFTTPKSRTLLAGNYSSSGTGLQGESDSFSEIVKHDVHGEFSSLYKFNEIFSINYGISGNFFYRYKGIYQLTEENLSQNGENARNAEILPFVDLNFNAGNLKFSLGAQYDADFALSEKETLHRGEFSAFASWENHIVTVFGKAGAVVGNFTGPQSVLVPFKAGADFRIPGSFSERNLLFSVAGGMDSFKNSRSNIEEKFKFTESDALLSETSDWFARADVFIPFKDFLDLFFSGEFRKTAFNNGIYDVDFSKTHVNGIYSAVKTERNAFNTNAGFNFSFKNVNFGALWNAHWLYVPGDEYGQSILLSAVYEGASSKWNTGIYVQQGLGAHTEKIPVVSADFDVHLSRSISLALELNDIVKLVTNETRRYSDSIYAQKSGNAVLLVKFQF